MNLLVISLGRLQVAVCVVLFAYLIVAAGLTSTVNAASASFGHVNVGSSNNSTFGGLFVCNFTSPQDLGNITQIEAYLATGGTLAKAVIYSDTNGAADVLLAQSAQINVDGTAGTWVSFDVSYAGSPNTVYWLGVLLVNAGTYYYSPGVAGRAIYSASAPDAPDQFLAGTANQTDDLSVYAVYTPAPLQTPEPTDQGFGWLATPLLWIAVAGIIIVGIVAIVYFAAKKRGKT